MTLWQNCDHLSFLHTQTVHSSKGFRGRKESWEGRGRKQRAAKVGNLSLFYKNIGEGGGNKFRRIWVYKVSWLLIFTWILHLRVTRKFLVNLREFYELHFWAHFWGLYPLLGSFQETISFGNWYTWNLIESRPLADEMLRWYALFGVSRGSFIKGRTMRSLWWRGRKLKMSIISQRKGTCWSPGVTHLKDNTIFKIYHERWKFLL